MARVIAAAGRARAGVVESWAVFRVFARNASHVNALRHVRSDMPKHSHATGIFRRPGARSPCPRPGNAMQKNYAFALFLPKLHDQVA